MATGAVTAASRFVVGGIGIHVDITVPVVAQDIVCLVEEGVVRGVVEGSGILFHAVTQCAGSMRGDIRHRSTEAVSMTDTITAVWRQTVAGVATKYCEVGGVGMTTEATRSGAGSVQRRPMTEGAGLLDIAG